MTAPVAPSSVTTLTKYFPPYSPPQNTGSLTEEQKKKHISLLPNDVWGKHIFPLLVGGTTNQPDQFIGLSKLAQTNQGFRQDVTTYLGGEQTYREKLNIFNLGKQLWDGLRQTPLHPTIPFSIIPSQQGCKLLEDSIAKPTDDVDANESLRKIVLKAVSLAQLTKNIPTLSEKQRLDLLNAAEDLTVPEAKGLVLAALATQLEYFSPEQRNQIFEGALDINGDPFGGEATPRSVLASNLQYFSEQQRAQLLDKAFEVNDIECLHALAKNQSPQYLSKEQHERILNTLPLSVLLDSTSKSQVENLLAILNPEDTTKSKLNWKLLTTDRQKILVDGTVRTLAEAEANGESLNGGILSGLLNSMLQHLKEIPHHTNR